MKLLSLLAVLGITGCVNQQISPIVVCKIGANGGVYSLEKELEGSIKVFRQKCLETAKTQRERDFCEKTYSYFRYALSSDAELTVQKLDEVCVILNNDILGKER